MGRGNMRQRAAAIFLMVCVATIMSTGCSATSDSGVVVTLGNTDNESIERGNGVTTRDHCTGEGGQTLLARDAVSGTPGTQLTYAVNKARAVIVGEGNVRPGNTASNQMTAPLTAKQSDEVARTGRLTVRLEDFVPFVASLDWITICD